MTNAETILPRYRSGWVARYRLSLVRDGRTKYDAARECGHPDSAARFIHEILEDAHQETMGCLLLDTRYRAIGYHLAYRGVLDRLHIEPRGLLVPGLLANAAAIIAFHNHPSGDPSPSAEDLAFTRRLMQAGEIVGVRVLDHLVVGEAPRYSSLRQLT